MGCWNETCAVSHMTISAGEKVKIIFIAQNGYVHEIETEAGNKFDVDEINRNYHSDLWYPIGMPISCDYDDYGRGESFSNDKECEFTLEVLRKMCLSIKEGENSCHDFATDGIKDIETAITLANENRLYYKTIYQGCVRPIVKIFIKQSVWNALLELSFDYFRVDKPVTLSDYRLATQANIESLINIESNGGDVANYLNPFDYGLIQEKNTDTDLLARLVRYIGGGDQFKRVGLYSGDSITSERLIQLKNEMAEFSFVNSILSCLRINYAPTTGSGGQDDNSNMFPIVFKKFAEISDKDSHKYDELK